MAQLITGTAPLSYQGVSAQTPPNFMRVNRIPTTQDYEFVIGTFWLYVATNPLANPAQALYQLARLSNTASTPTATWIQIYPATAATPPLSIADGGTNAITFGTVDGTVYYDGVRLVTTATGTSGYVLTSNGAGMAPTYQAGGSGGIATLNADTGSATGTTVTIAGGVGIATTATGSTLTLNLDVPVTVPHGGTGQTSLMDHSVLVGASAAGITQLTPATNGQVLLGSTGADPAFAALTSTTSTIAYTTGAHSLSVDINAPVPIAYGGTNATSMTNADGVVYYDGTKLVTTSAGTADYVLTSNGPGMAPEFKVAGGGGGAGANAFLYQQQTNGGVFTSANSSYILGTTVAFTKLFDNGGTQFAGTTFTASATGVWYFDVLVTYANITAGGNGIFYLNVGISVTDGTTPANTRTYGGPLTFGYATVGQLTYGSASMSTFAPMSVGATATFTAYFIGQYTASFQPTIYIYDQTAIHSFPTISGYQVF